jgi:predicted CopG family antitoxin
MSDDGSGFKVFTKKQANDNEAEIKTLEKKLKTAREKFSDLLLALEEKKKKRIRYDPET